MERCKKRSLEKGRAGMCGSVPGKYGGCEKERNVKVSGSLIGKELWRRGGGEAGPHRAQQKQRLHWVCSQARSPRYPKGQRMEEEVSLVAQW